MSDVLRQGDVVLVPFPFTDFSGVKTRPAVVVSNDVFKGEDVILCAVTSQKAGVQEVEITDIDLAAGRLPVVSYVRYGKVVSMKRNSYMRLVAKVGKMKLAEIIDGLMKLVECG